MSPLRAGALLARADSFSAGLRKLANKATPRSPFKPLTADSAIDLYHALVMARRSQLHPAFTRIFDADEIMARNGQDWRVFRNALGRLLGVTFPDASG